MRASSLESSTTAIKVAHYPEDRKHAVPMADIETAKEIAAAKGLPYQTYIKMLLHEALRKEHRSA